MGIFPLISWNIGPLTLYGYGVMVALGFCALWLALSTTQKRHQVKAHTATTLLMLGIPLSLVAGRFIYVLIRRSMVFYNPVDGAFLGLWPFFRLWEGGISLLGMLLGLIGAAALTTKTTAQPFHRLFDWLAAPAALLMAFLTGGAILAGEGYGEILEAPLFLFSLSNEFGESYRAVFLMEAIVYLVIAGLLLSIKVQRPLGRGLSMLAMVACAQLFLESLHRDNYMRLESNGFIRVNQLLALCMLLVVLLYLTRKDGRSAPKRVALSWGMLALTAVFVIGAEFYEKLPFPTLLLYSLSALSCMALALVLVLHLKSEAKFGQTG